MKPIVTMGIRNLPSRPRPLPQLYSEYLEEAVLAERLGFDAVWASEHHFSEDAWNPSPLTFLAAVAARTERVRIGTYVLLLPLHNPVRVAEDIAVLDNLSSGRGHNGTPFIVGTCADAARALAAYRDLPLTHLSLNFHHPGMETDAVRRSMALFARTLMPLIKAW
jgi:alkanesulfonate monooxygenase SsuD/methylene tetrahydromethanopterin reductase-like flavin-dependent oxidoreductase (luciferase family)